MLLSLSRDYPPIEGIRSMSLPRKATKLYGLGTLPITGKGLALSNSKVNSGEASAITPASPALALPRLPNLLRMIPNQFSGPAPSRYVHSRHCSKRHPWKACCCNKDPMKWHSIVMQVPKCAQS
ncbi:ABC transporter 1 [Fusarium oxysporum f. sp. albedinis]|nr:ABC transporter 1 [Fusarium oxysporum f. sp. albedinis]